MTQISKVVGSSMMLKKNDTNQFFKASKDHRTKARRKLCEAGLGGHVDSTSCDRERLCDNKRCGDVGTVER